MLRRLLWLAIAGFALVGVAAAAAGWLLLRGGVGSRAEPTRVETALARSLRSIAIPRASRDLKNPVSVTPEAIEDGLSHFADHCASCHANDGSGQTEMGKGLYPKVPDMRQAETQNLADGELFYIIENGVKFTGMPAWGDGTPESATASWNLVHFIRRLPRLTPADVRRMEALNPKSPHDWRESEQTAAGKDPARPATPTHKHRGHH